MIEKENSLRQLPGSGNQKADKRKNQNNKDSGTTRAQFIKSKIRNSEEFDHKDYQKHISQTQDDLIQKNQAKTPKVDLLTQKEGSFADRVQNLATEDNILDASKAYSSQNKNKDTNGN